VNSFASSTHGFAAQQAAVHYMLNAYGSPAQIDASLQASADRLVRVLESPPPVDAMECHGGMAEAQAGRRQQLANIIDARHQLALAAASQSGGLQMAGPRYTVERDAVGTHGVYDHQRDEFIASGWSYDEAATLRDDSNQRWLDALTRRESWAVAQ
jgi:hypothetical protein